MGILPITGGKLPAAGRAKRPRCQEVRSRKDCGRPAPAPCPPGARPVPALAGPMAALGSRSPSIAVRVTARESHPPIYDQPRAARAAGPAAWPDAEPALVLAHGDQRGLRGHRPGRLGAGRRRPGGPAGPGAAGAAGPAGQRQEVPAPAQRRQRRPARLPDQPALVPGAASTGAAGRTGCRGRGGGLLLARVRRHRGAAAVLRRARHPGRRPPEGRQRPGRAADRRGPAVPARVLHSVAVGRGLAGRALPGQRPQRAAADASCATPAGRPRGSGSRWPTARPWPRRSGSPR